MRAAVAPDTQLFDRSIGSREDVAGQDVRQRITTNGNFGVAHGKLERILVIEDYDLSGPSGTQIALQRYDVYSHVFAEVVEHVPHRDTYYALSRRSRLGCSRPQRQNYHDRGEH